MKERATKGRDYAFANLESRRPGRNLAERPLTGALLTDRVSKSNDRSGLGLFDVCPTRGEA